MVIVSISVTIAMYCLIQLYVVVSEPLKPHKPLLKLFSVKAVGKGRFLTFSANRSLTGGFSVSDVLASYCSFCLCHDRPRQRRKSRGFLRSALPLTRI